MSVITDIHFDPENEEIVIQEIDEDGEEITTQPKVSLKLLDLQYATELLAKMRRVHFGGQRAYGLFTKSENEADDGHDDGTEDVYIGPTMMAVVSYHQDDTNGDYLVCTLPGTAETVNVAVEPHLQSAIVAQTTPDSVAWAYTSYVEATQQRTATAGSTVRTEYISPPFLAGDIVPVFACSNTGVIVDEADVDLVALTGRQWASTSS